MRVNEEGQSELLEGCRNRRKSATPLAMIANDSEYRSIGWTVGDNCVLLSDQGYNEEGFEHLIHTLKAGGAKRDSQPLQMTLLPGSKLSIYLPIYSPKLHCASNPTGTAPRQRKLCRQESFFSGIPLKGPFEGSL